MPADGSVDVYRGCRAYAGRPTRCPGRRLFSQNPWIGVSLRNARSLGTGGGTPCRRFSKSRMSALSLGAAGPRPMEGGASGPSGLKSEETAGRARDPASLAFTGTLNKSPSPDM